MVKEISIPCGLTGDLGTHFLATNNLILVTLDDDRWGNFINREGAKQLKAFLEAFLRGETEEEWDGTYGS